MGRSVRGEFAYQAVYRYLLTQITQMRGAEDERLPSLRDLARRLRVSLATVQCAYSLLEAEGRVHTVPKSGYYARPAHLGPNETVHHQVLPLSGSPPPCATLEPLLLAHERRLGGQAQEERVAQAVLRRAIAARLTHSSGRYWRAEDVSLSPDLPALLSTSLHALNLQGSTILVATPCCARDVQVLEQLDMRIVEWPLEVPDFDALARLLEAEKVHLVVMPACLASPPGRWLSPDEQRELARLLGLHGVWLLENDQDSEQCFAGSPASHLRDWVDPRRLLVHGTLEAIVGAEAPIAYLLSPHPEVREAIARRNFRLPPRRVLALARVLSRSDLDSQLEQARSTLRGRMATLCQLMDQHHLGDWLAYAAPQGGYTLWCRLHRSIDIDSLCARLHSPALRVLAGTRFSVQGLFEQSLALSWEGDDAAALGQALADLARALSDLHGADHPVAG
ncbi:aminotransferase class I/II-fold pyridoxal phosphate-dependent enzyme [Pseudomonas sp. K1(2024)]|uniref:Aminotransferase class I/II-fold pyridoxal phosphate-dependent enzyme n=1 Tax=Pseudomonas boreofloridensis TaxID=3064348 RepID=A0ABV4Z7Y6_9PSED|nr:aminotransferase class I/II-fold pyridoxal phosphate-dependent enzyme [Pseudomonas sp. K13]MDO7902206.1 aminotransferase class I/II-fold pyridoxal phosphate-dependent enzyme [Pseudomonas sp. K13]